MSKHDFPNIHSMNNYEPKTDLLYLKLSCKGLPMDYYDDLVKNKTQNMSNIKSLVCYVAYVWPHV